MDQTARFITTWGTTRSWKHCTVGKGATFIWSTSQQHGTTWCWTGCVWDSSWSWTYSSGGFIFHKYVFRWILNRLHQNWTTGNKRHLKMHFKSNFQHLFYIQFLLFYHIIYHNVYCSMNVGNNVKIIFSIHRTIHIMICSHVQFVHIRQIKLWSRVACHVGVVSLTFPH